LRVESEKELSTKASRPNRPQTRKKMRASRRAKLRPVAVLSAMGQRQVLRAVSAYNNEPSAPQPRRVRVAASDGSIIRITNYKLKITMDEKDKQWELPDDDRVVFVPAEDIRSIERALDKMEQARQELLKIGESLNNGELRVEN
jgi:hypothetical protein